jgi:hypothetical protein
MKKSCLVALLALPLFSAAYFFVLAGNVDRNDLYWMAPWGGFVCWLTWGFLQHVVLNIKDGRLIAKSQTTAQPVDGEPVAAVGRIAVSREPLTAPFTGRRCAAYAYEYNKVSRSTENSAPGAYLVGFALNPTSIQTKRGEIRLLSFPFEPKDFPKEPCGDDEHYDRARAYLTSTTFKDLRGSLVTSMFSQMSKLLSDDDGVVREDWKIAELNNVNDASLVEQIIPEGAEVCVFGIYSSRLRGVAPDKRHMGLYNRIFLGRAEALEARFKRAAGAYLIASVIFFGLGNLVILGTLRHRGVI